MITNILLGVNAMLVLGYIVLLMCLRDDVRTWMKQLNTSKPAWPPRQPLNPRSGYVPPPGGFA